jgi:DVNP family
MDANKKPTLLAGGGRTRKNRNRMEGGAKMTTGSKAQVWHGTARHTPGGLTRKDLMRHKGKIVSRRKHAAGLKAIRKLRKLGYVAKKGTFKLFRKQK